MTEKTLTPPAGSDSEWHSLSLDDTLKRLAVQEHGLSSDEAAKRLKQFGLNQLTEAPRPGFLSKLWDQLNNFVVILLIVASIISAILGEWVDAAAIMLIVVLNAVLGIVQESRAEEALAALKKMAAPEAQILRDGKRVSVPARELVPGDIVFLEAGNFVPADLRLLEAVNMRVEEASLTGESLAVQKNACPSTGWQRPPRRPAQYRLHGHYRVLRARAWRGHQHRHEHAAGAHCHHAAKCRNGTDPAPAPAGRTWQIVEHWRVDPGGGGLRCIPDQLHRHVRAASRTHSRTCKNMLLRSPKPS